MKVIALFVLIYMIVLRPVDKYHHVGILLDGTRLTEVTKLWAFALQTLTSLNGTVKLR